MNFDKVTVLLSRNRSCNCCIRPRTNDKVCGAKLVLALFLTLKRNQEENSDQRQDYDPQMGESPHKVNFSSIPFFRAGSIHRSGFVNNERKRDDR